jgi:hypothetical protein
MEDRVSRLSSAALAQHTFALHRAQADFDHLLLSLDGGSPNGQIALARLRSVASPCASAWLKALPSAHTFTLPDSDFRLAMRWRLGLPVLPRGAHTVICFCGKPLAATDSENAHTCITPMDPNRLRMMRHDNLVEVVRRAMRRGGDFILKGAPPHGPPDQRSPPPV